MHRLTIAAALFTALSASTLAQDSARAAHTGGANFSFADGSVRFVRDSVPDHMLMEVYVVDETETRNADGPDPVLMVISNQDFWHVVDEYDLVDVMDDDVVFSKKGGKGPEMYLVIRMKEVLVSS